MHVILLPFFIAKLFVKNVVSWSKIFVEAFGFSLALLALIAVNVYLSYTLFVTMTLHSQTATRLTAAETTLQHQREFWQRIVKEAPGHRQAQQIQKTLAE